MKPGQLRSSAVGLSIHGPKFFSFVSDLSAAADRIAALEAEADTLRAKLAAAQSLRLGRAPTVEDCDGPYWGAIVWWGGGAALALQTQAWLSPEIVTVIPIDEVRKVASPAFLWDAHLPRHQRPALPLRRVGR